MHNPKNNGWISLHRKILQSPIFNKPPEYFKVWIYLLLNVDHEKGIGFFSWNNIKNDCHITNSQLKKCFSFMEKEQMISRKKMPRGVEITILNWDKYQHTNERPTKAPTKRPTKRPTETANEVSNNADIQERENLKETNKETNYETNKETNHNTINTISNNTIISNDIIEGCSSLNENEKDKDTSIAGAGGKTSGVSSKDIYRLVKTFYEIMGFPWNEGAMKENSRAAKSLLEIYSFDEIVEAIKIGIEETKKEKRDYKSLIPRLETVKKRIHIWLSKKQEKQQKQEARNYGW